MKKPPSTPAPEKPRTSKVRAANEAAQGAGLSAEATVDWLLSKDTFGAPLPEAEPSRGAVRGRRLRALAEASARQAKRRGR